VRALESTDLILNCTKYGNCSLWKVVKIVATRCQILRLKCTKFDFGWGSAPDPFSLDFREPISKGRGEEGQAGMEGREEDKAGEGEGLPASIMHRAPNV
jgi:hypothetical protein